MRTVNAEPLTGDPLENIRMAERFVIIGQTLDGRTFRPSDWAERLAGVMAGFRPSRPSAGRAPVGSQRQLGYSPYVQPGNYNGFKAVFIDRRLHALEPMAHHFVINFARDNGLRTEVLAS